MKPICPTAAGNGRSRRRKRQKTGIQYHIVRDLGKMEIRNINRDMLQRYLERKTKEGLSHSVVHHLRCDLRAILRFAFQDGLVDLNAGESLFTPGVPGPRDRGKVLTAEQVQQILKVLGPREQLFVRFAIFSGMRPGEIIGLQWNTFTTTTLISNSASIAARSTVPRRPARSGRRLYHPTLRSS
jgi:integrase